MEDFTTIVRAIPAWSWALGCLLIAAIGLVYWYRIGRDAMRDRVMMAVWQLQLEHLQDPARFTTTPTLYDVHREVELWSGDTPIASVARTLADLVDLGVLVMVQTVTQAGQRHVPTTYSLPHHVSH